MRRLFCALLAATAALMPTASGRAEEAIQARYVCKGALEATEVTALFFNGQPSEVVLLSGSTGAERLLQGPSGSGARYIQGDAVFWVKGDQASWQQGRSTRPLQCKVSSGSRGPIR